MSPTFMPSTCEVCGTSAWDTAWSGPVRDGKFGKLTAPTRVGRCRGCGVERLDESACKDESFYKSTEYRLHVDADATIEGFFREHDPLQFERLNAFPPHQLRGRHIADVGCAAGAFLDHAKGLIKTGIAVEPAPQYHASLAERGYTVYPGLAEAAREWKGRIDVCFSFSVIEHVLNPLEFLQGMRELMTDNGLAVISTPNRNDVLMDLLPDAYPPFFYRTVHRWYFDRASLVECARRAGLGLQSISCMHRFGLSNAMRWLRDRKPTGRDTLTSLTDLALDANWRIALEREFRGDYLYATFTRTP